MNSSMKLNVSKVMHIELCGCILSAGPFFLLFHDSLTSANPFYLVDVFDSRLNVVFRFANMKRLPNQPKYRER